MIFIDTGAFLARYIANDQHHSVAIEFWQRIAREGLPCVTTNFVIDETITLLGRRASYQFAAERAKTFYESEILLILRPTQEDELAAIEWFEKFADQSVSFTDCISFAMMKRNSIQRVFGFDHHFAVAGFTVEP